MEPCPICTTKSESVLTKLSSLVIGTHSLFPSGIDSWEGKSEPCSLRKHLSFMDTICESWIQELQIHLLPPCPGKPWHVIWLLYASVSQLLNWWQVIWTSETCYEHERMVLNLICEASGISRLFSSQGKLFQSKSYEIGSLSKGSGERFWSHFLCMYSGGGWLQINECSWNEEEKVELAWR